MPLVSISISALDAQQCKSKKALTQTEFSSSLDEGHCDNGFGDRLSSMDLGLELTYTAISDFLLGRHSTLIDLLY